MSKIKSVTLYEAQRPFWLTDATIRDNGDLTITSGDASNEWILTVPADRKGFVLRSLLQHVTLDLPETVDEDERLLAALLAKFGGEKNPYEAIERFLTSTGNKPRASNWLDLP